MTEPSPSSGPIAIIGAGIAGIAAAQALRSRGIEDFVILEKANAPGGVWRDNVYPGVACDVPSDNYGFAFAPHPGWTRRLAPGAEIERYLASVFGSLGLAEKTRFGVEVRACVWEGGAWSLDLGGQSRLRAASVICATGALRDPKWPDLPGLESFGTLIHTARWDSAQDLSELDIGVVGTGASAVQAIPELAKTARSVSVFMRSPPWIIPMSPRFALPPARWLLRASPALYRAYCQLSDEFLIRGYGGIFLGKSRALRGLFTAIGRLALRTVSDPALRAKLRPDYPLGAKRILYAKAFYPAMQRANVRLITEPITRVAEGEVTAGHISHRLDCLVIATGFEAARFHAPIKVRGLEGHTPEALWGRAPHAFRGVMLRQIPSFYMLLGPSSPIASVSNTRLAEWQAGYIAQCIAHERETGVALRPREAAARDDRDREGSAARRSVWLKDDTQSWYLSSGNALMYGAQLPARVRAGLRRPDFSELEEISRRPGH
ncbi:MAG: NAD(P)/FAD-dependent oxidoreductase [Pseudomonadota bacterium]